MLIWDELFIPVAKLTAIPSFAISYAIGGRSKFWRWFSSALFLLYPFEVAAQFERGTSRILIVFCMMIVTISGIVGFQERNGRRAEAENVSGAEELKTRHPLA
jgi:hypothetical protein